MCDEFKKNYLELKKTFPDLPSFEELDDEYELTNYVAEKKLTGKFVDRTIRRTITYNLNSHIGHLHGFIMPTQHSAISVEESNFFSEEEKEEIIQIITKLMIYLRESFECELKKDLELNVKFIIKAHKNWLKIKEEIIKIIPKLVDGWKTSLEKKKENKYY